MFFGAWSREGAVRPHAAGVRSKIRIIILNGKNPMYFPVDQNGQFSSKNPFGPRKCSCLHVRSGNYYILEYTNYYGV